MQADLVRLALGKCYWPMVIAMAVVLMVQMPVYQIVHVISMRYRFMSTVWTMNMVCSMTRASMTAGASCWISLSNIQRMFYDNSIAVLMMQVTVMEVIDMVAMDNAGVAAVCAVNMWMVFVSVTHRVAPTILLIVYSAGSSP